jgi:energy-coupling factor transporter ATP-binding protein EcfA2
MPRRLIQLTPATEFRMRPVKWLWEDRVPVGEICLVPGREGIGKSTFLAWMAAMITRGELPGEHYGKPRAVLYSASEDAWDYTIAPRMFAAGADLSMVYRISVTDTETMVPGRLILPTDISQLPEAAARVDAAVLMCDPVLSNLADELNPNQSREVRKALEPLARAAERAKLAVLGLVHLNKTRDVDIATMVAGARAWMEVARAGIAIVRDERGDPDGGDPEFVQVVTQIKNNLGSMDLPSLEYRLENHSFPADPDEHGHSEEIRVGRVVWSEQVSATDAHQLVARRPGTGPYARVTTSDHGAEIVRILEEAGRGMPPREIAEQIDGLSDTNARQLLRRMVTRGEIRRIGDTNLYTVDRNHDD